MKKKQPAPVDIESIWHDFMATGRINSTALRPEIRDSWMRSRKLGVNPHDGSSPTVLSEQDFQALLSRKKT